MPERMSLSDILVENSTYANTWRLKRKLVEEGLLEDVCSECGIKNEWNGKPLSLQLDHINGNNRDHRIENLRILCPNCHSQTSTYAGKNTKGIAKKEVIVIKCIDCGEEISKQSKTGRCKKCADKNRRKVKRPSIEQLLSEIEELGYEATGRKYNVSGNSIRKWVI